uniref:Uncharacterized protein n=1 Tax=Avena sativa TaxID=4498 RepID=A0ACD5VNS7_AVESA
MCVLVWSADGGGGGGGLLLGAGGGGCYTRLAADAFAFFCVGLAAPAAVDGHLWTGAFLFAVGRTLPASCAAATLVCTVGRGGAKRARAAPLPASAAPLGFAATIGFEAAAKKPNKKGCGYLRKRRQTKTLSLSHLVLLSTWIPPTVVECRRYDHAVPVDKRCYIGDLRNARGATSSGLPIQVTFRAAGPPLLSYLCINCPGLDFSILPEPRVVATDADLVLLRVPIGIKAPFDVGSWDYFVYRPRARQLDLLPNPRPMSFPDDSATALLSREDGAWYAVAAISNSIIGWDFRLHLYRSSDSASSWITMPVSLGELVRDKLVPLPRDLEGDMLYHKTAKTLAIGGERGTVAWVDLWRGILLCDVLAEERPVRFRDIPLPVPARGNWGRLLEQREPGYIRDVAVGRRRDTIKYVEMEIWPPTTELDKMTSTSPAADSYLEWARSSRSSSSIAPGGWKATTWSLPVPAGSFADWQPGCEVEAKDVTVDTCCRDNLLLLSRLKGSDATLALHKLPMAYPTMSIDDDIVYFVSSTKSRHTGKLELVIAVDVRNKTLRGVAKLDAHKKFSIMPAFCTCHTCTYPRKNTTAGEFACLPCRYNRRG